MLAFHAVLWLFTLCFGFFKRSALTLYTMLWFLYLCYRCVSRLTWYNVVLLTEFQIAAVGWFIGLLTQSKFVNRVIWSQELAAEVFSAMRHSVRNEIVPHSCLCKSLVVYNCGSLCSCNLLGFHEHRFDDLHSWYIWLSPWSSNFLAFRALNVFELSSEVVRTPIIESNK